MASIPARAVNLGHQAAAIKAVVPNAEVTVRRGELVCTLTLQPAPACKKYTVRLAYRHRRRPRVTIIDPPLTMHPDSTSLPHVYADGTLCLYLPGEWKEDMLLSDTILPWTSAWLLHYELWLILGHWTGTGDAHVVPTPKDHL
ncbi:hypothetical protein [Yinghuangia sp. YIM S09857]|uniref:hypothetical protein n=1 Tax=Yinghuangia sp. YIM S09857 TaxID=3436929 RepID=UPI003F53A755